MTHQTPLVSICIPTYNGEKFISEALYSAVNQTYPNIEIIISDDQSQDSTLKFVRDIGDHLDVKFSIFHHTPNGIGSNWNNCLKHANGEFIKFLFQDDILNPNCIEEMVNLAGEDDDIGLVFAQREIIGDSKSMKYAINDIQEDFESIFEGSEIIRRADFFDNPKNKIGEPPSVLLKYEAIEKIGLFDERLKQSLDYEYWYRICNDYKIGFIKKPLTQFRMHECQASNVNTKTIVIDKFLLPLIFVKKYFWKSHPKAKLKMLNKLIQGFFRYYIFNKV